jgi:hypothetical protein
MTTIAIMQPTYIPWVGYFDLMDQVDIFVLLDTVQFSYQSWQHRNRIRTESGLRWLTIPVPRGSHPGQRLDSVAIAEVPKVPDSHVNAITAAYRKAPYFDGVFSPLVTALREGWLTGRLTGVTVPLLVHLAAQLGIETKIAISSSMPADGDRSGRLVALCRTFQATTYLSPLGSVAYLRDEVGKFDAAGITVVVHDYEHPQYSQLFAPFLPYASVIDLIFNVGDDALAVIRSGRRSPRLLDQVVP